MSEFPSWSKGVADKYGNISCKVCGNVQSPSFEACIKCCKHNILEFTDEWIGCDDGGGWGIACGCKYCGNNFDFDADTLKNNYFVVRNNVETTR